MESIGLLAEHVWWIVAGVLIVLEMLTGTFYLLVLGVVAALTGIAAWMGATFLTQLFLAIGLLVLGLWVLKWYKAKTHGKSPIRNNDLEKGNWVDVIEWHENGHASVRYRETKWQAVLANVDDAQLERMCIHKIQGNTLVIGSQPV